MRLTPARIRTNYLAGSSAGSAPNFLTLPGRLLLGSARLARKRPKPSACAALFLGLALTACGDKHQPLPPVAQNGELVVVSYRSPTTYYHNADEKPAGFEHDLVKLFAEELGVKYRFVLVPSFSQVLPALAKNQAHIAAAGIPVTGEWRGRLRFGPPYQAVQLQLAYRSNGEHPVGWRDLGDKAVVVPAGSSAIGLLKEARKHVPSLHWQETERQDLNDLLEKVAAGDVAYTVADSQTISLAKNTHPQLATAFNVGFPMQLAWAFPQDGEASLQAQAKKFFAKIEQNGTLQRLLDRYYGHIKRLDQSDVIAFLQKKDTVLPHYRSLFEEAQLLTGIDWRLLAALAYQESHWDPHATSFTNVRGIMMLTEDTADDMNVSDRLDPRQSILAGARYFLNLKDKLPQHIRDPDRTWMALAVYNTGFGHVEDARILAQRQGLDPDSWLDLKKTLPLLAKDEYAVAAKFGYARGGEAVILTENVRTYYDILSKFETPFKPSPAYRWIERNLLDSLFSSN